MTAGAAAHRADPRQRAASTKTSVAGGEPAPSNPPAAGVPAAAPVPARVITMGAVGSTNDVAREALAQEGAPLWVRATQQTKGRGRRSRAWASPPGNLYASHGFVSPLSDTAFALLPLTASLALADAIAAISPIAPQLKWPNDVLVDGAKTAGILLECEGMPRRVVIGFGVNIVSAPPPEEGALRATHLAAHAPVTADAMFDALATALAARLAQLGEADGVTMVRANWLERAVGVGHPVIVRFDQSVREGRFLGLDEMGRLMLGEADGAIRLVAAGDVFLRSDHE